MKFKIYKFNSVTSTNDVAINLIKEKNKISGCVLAKVQTKGRGTNGKKWISNKGNFFSSLFFPLDERFPPFNHFSIINPIIVTNVIKKFCNKKKINLKFPNDVLLNGKKICGILQEVIISKKKKYLIVGIGLNIISNPKIKNKYKTTNIFFETSNKPKVNEIVDLIIFSYENFFKSLNVYNYGEFKKKAELIALN